LYDDDLDAKMNQFVKDRMEQYKDQYPQLPELTPSHSPSPEKKVKSLSPIKRPPRTPSPIKRD
jgi:hypothetical protein